MDGLSFLRLHGWRRRCISHFANPGSGRFHRLKFTTDPDNKVYQLLDQQFANLYRIAGRARPDLKALKQKYGYELDVPVGG